MFGFCLFNVFSHLQHWVHFLIWTALLPQIHGFLTAVRNRATLSFRSCVITAAIAEQLGVDAAALLHTDLGAEKISSALTPQEKGRLIYFDLTVQANPSDKTRL